MIITQKNYFGKRANKEYMSVSQFKQFEKCEAMAMAEIRGKYTQPTTTAMLVGSYVDAFYDGTLDIFKAEHPDIFKRDGSLKSDFDKANDIIRRTTSDRMFSRFMAGDKQVIMTGEIAGVKYKIKIDSLCKDKIVDLKVMRDMDNVYVDEYGKLPFFEAWEYDLQGAVYQEIVRQNTGKKLPFYLAVATKEDVPDIEIIKIEQDLLDVKLGKVIDYSPSYDAIKSGILEPGKCGKCRFCKDTKKLKVPVSSDEFYLLKEEKMSQKQLILNHLKSGKKLTKFTAFSLFGITKADTVISKLRKDGHKILSFDTKIVNRYGRRTHYYTYYMEVQNND